MTTIYYFSGTGNSLKIAKDLSNTIDDCKIIRITSSTLNLSTNRISNKIGFVFPVYYRGIPHMLREFVKKIQVNKNTYFFAVANFGGYAALTFEQLDKLLKDKGAYLNANFSVPMPGNMWFMYYPHPKKDFENRIRDEKKLCMDIAAKINKNFQNNLPDIENIKAEKKLYMDFQPSNNDENFWVNDHCTGCSICSKVCPAQNIKSINNKPAWQHHCEQCLACLHWCPVAAIEYKSDSIKKERYHNPLINIREMFV